MKVFKFGGASVKDAEGVINVGRILKSYENEELFIVISAMGKMTNAFEMLTSCYFEGKECVDNALNPIKSFHLAIIKALFSDSNHFVYKDVDTLFSKLSDIFKTPPAPNYNYVYDTIVPYGEKLSALILSHYLNASGYKNTLVDATQIIKTDATYREARINWEKTSSLVSEKWKEIQTDGNLIAVTQGFIGSSAHGYTTTLGREGSDFTASILAYSLKAKEVVIWKDVPGVLNADPREMSDYVKIDRMSYFDAIELSYYGATVIHPKTLKPLQNLGIPLLVKSFLNPEENGTFIGNAELSHKNTPCYIFKKNQILISIMPYDFSFIVEHNISAIFAQFTRFNVKVNLMQNSALSFSVCADNDSQKIPALLKALKKEYKIYYNTSLELITIRHYDDDAVANVCKNREILLEQKTRNTIQLVLK